MRQARTTVRPSNEALMSSDSYQEPSDPQREHKGQTQHLCYRQDGFAFTTGKTKNLIVFCTTQRVQQAENVDYKNELHLSYHTLSKQD